MHLEFGETTNMNADKQPRPHVAPYLRSVEKPNKDGVIEFIPVLWVKVTSQGSKDTLDKDAEGWLKGLEDHAEGGRIPSSWPTEYRKALKNWTDGQELPAMGTPIKNWPAVNVAQRVALDRAGVQSVEDLALANDETKGRIGMGSERLVQLAQAWVADRTGPGALAAKLQSALVANEGLTARIAELEKNVSELLGHIPKADLPVAPARPSGVLKLETA